MNKKLRKTIGCICLALAIVLTQIPARNVMAASDFKMDGTKIIGYSGTASVVSLPSDAKEIESEAFANCRTMTTLNIPKNVKRIGAGAFRGCDNLKTVNIAEGCEEIDNQAFADCKNLDFVSIPSTVETLQSGIFSGDRSLSSVSIDLNNPKYVCRDGVIYSLDLTHMIEMCPGRVEDFYALPGSVEEIDKYAFWGCKNLKEVDISHYMGDIPAFAFSYCRGLETIEIPPSVNNIDSKAFENCRRLTDVTIPSNVRYIASNAFDGCAKLNIIAPAGSVAAEFFENFDAGDAAVSDFEDEDEIITKTTTVTSVSQSAITQYPDSDVSKSDVSDVTYQNMPAPKLDGKDVLGGSRIVGSNAVVFVDNSRMDVLDKEYVSTYDANASVSGNSVSDNGLITRKYTIVNGDTIADRSYYGDKELHDFNFPDGIKNIGDFAFARSGLKEIAIPDGVTNIGYGAFYHCDDLTSIKIPTSVTTIEPAAFGHTAWLDNWMNGSDSCDFLIVGDGNLIAYKGHAAQIGIPQGVKRICGEVFMNHTELSSVVLPESLEEVGEDAFNGCTALTQLTGGSQLHKISDRAFYGTNIENIHIGNQVANIGLQAFAGGNSQAIIFASKQIPTLSCEKTATRLSNEDYRDFVTNATLAVVPGDCNQIDNSILDERTKGFRGVVVSIVSNPSGVTKGSCELKYCSLLPDSNGMVNVPDEVTIDDANYVIDSMHEGAFDAYSDSSWIPGLFKGISVNGAVTGGKDINSGIDAKADADSDTADTNGIQIVDKIGIQNERVFDAQISSVDNDYQLMVSHDEEAENRLREAVRNEYGLAEEMDLFTMDLTLYDATGQIPITKLGKEKMEVTMSIPAGMKDSSLCLVTLDGNGQLETRLIDYVPGENETCIAFAVSHFSPYGIYRATGEFADLIDTKISNSSEDALKDKSPDTGDHLDPKWFLVAGFACLSLILLLKKDHKKKAA